MAPTAEQSRWPTVSPRDRDTRWPARAQGQPTRMPIWRGRQVEGVLPGGHCAKKESAPNQDTLVWTLGGYLPNPPHHP